MLPFLLLAMAVADTQSAPVTAVPPDQAASSDKKVCRSDHVVGSRVPSKRICRTAAEWAKLERGMDPATRLQMEQGMGLSGRMMNPGGSF